MSSLIKCRLESSHSYGFTLIVLGMLTVADVTASDKLDRVLELTSLIQQVLDKNPKIPQSKLEWQSAQARITQVSAYPDPMLSYSLAPQTIFSNQSDYGQIVSASQVMPWPGKLGLKREIAQWQANATQETIATTQLSLIASSKIRFAEWQFVHAAIEINEQNKILLQEFKNIAEIKFISGRVSKQDVLRAEVELTMLDRNDEALNRQKVAIAAQINTLLNQKPDSDLLSPERIFFRYPDIQITHLRDLVLKNHPQLKQIDAKITAAEKQHLLAKRNFYPDVQLKASYNNLRMNTENRFTFGVGINVPLQDKRHGALDEASLEKSALNWNKQALIAKIFELLHIHYARLTESQRVIKLYESRLLPLADENLQAARSDYEAGQGNFLDMITAEQNLIRLQLQLQQTRTDYQKQFALLENISGGSEIIKKAYLRSDESSIDKRNEK